MNKTVLITGGAKGLGKSLVELYANLNYEIIFTYLNSEKEAIDLERHLKDSNVIIKAYKVDLRKEEDVNFLVSKIDRLDILINNAAYNNDSDVFMKEGSEFIDILKVNLVAPFLLSQKLYPKLKESNGVIVNIASTNGIDTLYPESLDYDASKAGLLNLTKNLSEAFKPHVKVYAVAPDWIETEALRDMNPDFRKKEESRAGKFFTPEEVAEVVKNLTDGGTQTGTIIEVRRDK